LGGICGVYNPNKIQNVNLIRKMLEVNKRFGKEKVRIRVDEHIAFGFNALNITKESIHEIQPYTNEGITLVADLRLDRRSDLVSTLNKLGVAATLDEPDITLLYKCYKVWDLNFPEKIDGQFAFVLWDSRKRRLLCGRDPLGLKSFFYKWNGREFYFSNTLEALLETCDRKQEWNRDYFVKYIVNEGIVNDKETPYKGLHRLPGGHILLIDQKNELKTIKYWDIQWLKDIVFKDKNEYIERFREIYFQAIRDNMRSVGPVAVAMSGGLDSTSIFSTGCYLFPETTTQDFFPISLVFDKFPDEDERDYIKLVTVQYGKSPQWVVADDLWSFKNFPFDSPYTVEPFVNASTYCAQASLYKRAQQLGVKVMLTGAGGDEVLCGSNKVISDYIWKFQWYKAFENTKQLSKMRREPFLKNFVKYGVKPLYEKNSVSAWLAKDVQECILANRPKRGRIARERQEKQILQTITRYIDQYIAAPYGIEARHPFLDKQLVEFLIAIPMEQKLSGSIKKLILRKAMKGILPEQIRNRLDKTMHFSIIYLGIKEEWPEMAKALKKGYLAELQILNHEQFLNDVHLWRQGNTRDVDYLWTITTLELWLYKQDLGREFLENGMDMGMRPHLASLK
jgi:asparagine synthase (glutamine-hydrolysing)